MWKKGKWVKLNTKYIIQRSKWVEIGNKIKKKWLISIKKRYQSKNQKYVKKVNGSN